MISFSAPDHSLLANFAVLADLDCFQAAALPTVWEVLASMGINARAAFEQAGRKPALTAELRRLATLGADELRRPTA